MKIKNQFRLFLIGVITIPVLCVLFIPIYRRITRPGIIDKIGMMDKISELSISDRDEEVLKELLKSLPPKIEFILLANYTEILMTNFPEFIGQNSISDDKMIFQLMRDTSHQYFYQLSAPSLDEENIRILLISRISRFEKTEQKHNRHWSNMLNFIVLFMLILFVFCILMTVYISNTITKSITLLEKSTERIASGELDVEFEKNKPKHENEITRLTKNLEKMRLTLKDNEERRSKFIMGISHDLKTPVAVIKGYTEAMSDGVFEKPEELEKPLEIINLKTDQLESMIETLINFVRLNSIDWKQSLKEQNITPIIKDFAESSVTTGEIFKRKVTASINLPDIVKIKFDTMLFQRALENIFTNAVRYTKEYDSIEINSYIASDENSNMKKLILKIIDSGIGIEEKDLNRIFDMFYRGTNSRRESGIGIGLAVVKNIIQTHGWKIDVESKKSEGSQFKIEIPINAD